MSSILTVISKCLTLITNKAMREEYRGYVIEDNDSPYPTKNTKYQAYPIDYEGEPVILCATVEELKIEIDELLD